MRYIVILLSVWVLMLSSPPAFGADSGEAPPGSGKVSTSPQARKIAELMELLEMMEILEHLEVIEEMDSIQEDSNHEDND